MTVEDGYQRMDKRGPEWQAALADTIPRGSGPLQLPSVEEMQSNVQPKSTVNVVIGPVSADDVAKIREKALQDAAAQRASDPGVKRTVERRVGGPQQSGILRRTLKIAAKPGYWLAWPFMRLARWLRRLFRGR